MLKGKPKITNICSMILIIPSGLSEPQFSYLQTEMVRLDDT